MQDVMMPQLEEEAIQEEQVVCGGTGYIGGVTSWNGNSPSTQSGINNGNGQAKITFVGF